MKLKPHDKNVADVNAGHLKPDDLRLLSWDATYCGVRRPLPWVMNSWPLAVSNCPRMTGEERLPYPSTLYAHLDGFLMYLCDDAGMIHELREDGHYSAAFFDLCAGLREAGFDWVWIDAEGWDLPGAPLYDPDGREIAV